jgi:Rrf2 family cysteine metabolism transcriptional repressor
MMARTARTDYAAIAVLELARRHGDGRPVRLREIGAAEGMPEGFLTQILLRLKAAGIVESVRGAAGGYRLARPPAEITLADVREAVEGHPGRPVRRAAAAAEPASEDLSPPRSASRRGARRASAVLGDAWDQVAAAELEAMRSLDFQSLADRCRGAAAMYYI